MKVMIVIGVRLGEEGRNKEKEPNPK